MNISNHKLQFVLNQALDSFMLKLKLPLLMLKHHFDLNILPHLEHISIWL